MSDWAHSSPTLNPKKFHLRIDSEEFVGYDPSLPVTVRCARCPEWVEEVTREDMKDVYAAHKETHA